MLRFIRLTAASFTLTLLVAAVPTFGQRSNTPSSVVTAHSPSTSVFDAHLASVGETLFRVVPPVPKRHPARKVAPAAVVEAEPLWSPPVWFPEDARDQLWALDGVSGEGPSEIEGLRLRSKAAFVYDVDAGEVLLAHGADERQPVASLTKVVTSLAMASERPDLDDEICIDPEVWVGWPGAWSKLSTGVCTTGWDVLGAALVRSDNRAAYAMAKVSGLPYYPFIERMNEVASDLGMDMSTFTDPSGVEDENESTARDMTRALLAASVHPDVSKAASAPYWDVIETNERQRTRRLFTTNRLASRDDMEFLASKTGYTDTAQFCFSSVVRLESGRRVAITLLGAKRGNHRWADLQNVLKWVESLG